MLKPLRASTLVRYGGLCCLLWIVIAAIRGRVPPCRTLAPRSRMRPVTPTSTLAAHTRRRRTARRTGGQRLEAPPVLGRRRGAASLGSCTCQWSATHGSLLAVHRSATSACMRTSPVSTDAGRLYPAGPARLYAPVLSQSMQRVTARCWLPAGAEGLCRQLHPGAERHLRRRAQLGAAPGVWLRPSALRPGHRLQRLRPLGDERRGVGGAHVGRLGHCAAKCGRPSL
jgi:hypothetical protein